VNPHLVIVTIGIFYIVVFGGLSLLRREGLSTQLALEVLALTALVAGGAYLTGTTANPILFLILIYLLSMRGRLLTELANLFSARGRQRDAIRLLQLALGLFPDLSTRLIILVNMGIIQLRRQNPRSARDLLELVLDEAQHGGLGLKHEAACRFNLGLAHQQLGNDSQAVSQFNQAIETMPNSVYAQAAGRALDKRRQERKGKSDQTQ